MHYPCGTIVARHPCVIRHYCRVARCTSCAHDGTERRLGRFCSKTGLSLDPDQTVTSFQLDGTIGHAQFCRLRRRLHQHICYLRSNADWRWHTFGLIGVWTGTGVIGIVQGGRKSVLLDMGWRLDHMALGDVAERMARPSAQTLPLKNVWVTVNPRSTVKRPAE
jgi:hypothetical protein